MDTKARVALFEELQDKIRHTKNSAGKPIRGKDRILFSRTFKEYKLEEEKEKALSQINTKLKQSGIFQSFFVDSKRFADCVIAVLSEHINLPKATKKEIANTVLDEHLNLDGSKKERARQLIYKELR